MKIEPGSYVASRDKVDKSSKDDILWSDHSLTIRDVVYETMPTVVRVAEGFYGGNEAESFSRGDLLKLDFVKISV
jgi:hypothetical protein